MTEHRHYCPRCRRGYWHHARDCLGEWERLCCGESDMDAKHTGIGELQEGLEATLKKIERLKQIAELYRKEIAERKKKL